MKNKIILPIVLSLVASLSVAKADEIEQEQKIQQVQVSNNNNSDAVLSNYVFGIDYVESLQNLAEQETVKTGEKYTVVSEIKDFVKSNIPISIKATNLKEALLIYGEQIGERNFIKTTIYSNNVIVITK
jgi:hypothetical protein